MDIKAKFRGIQTKLHFRRLREIFKEDGFLAALDYDFQITRARRPFLNWLLETADLEYLKRPFISWHGDNVREHLYQYYTARYTGSFGRAKLVYLELK